ncbi:MAG: hypothetical protein ABIA67_04515, partial [Candidatus Margulisiibacteriota bacterium]
KIIVAESALSKHNKSLKCEKKIEKLLNQREYFPVKNKAPKKAWIPPKNHPWRKFTYPKNSKEAVLVS